MIFSQFEQLYCKIWNSRKCNLAGFGAAVIVRVSFKVRSRVRTTSSLYSYGRLQLGLVIWLVTVTSAR